MVHKSDMCADESKILFAAYSMLKSVNFFRKFPNYVCTSLSSKNLNICSGRGGLLAPKKNVVSQEKIQKNISASDPLFSFYNLKVL